MLGRIEITGFEIDTTTTPPAVVTKFRINRIPSSITQGAASSAGISSAVSADAFRTNVLA